MMSRQLRNSFGKLDYHAYCNYVYYSYRRNNSPCIFDLVHNLLCAIGGEPTHIAEVAQRVANGDLTGKPGNMGQDDRYLCFNGIDA